MLRYPRALGLLEGSWTQIGGEPALAMIVHGEAGTLLVHQPRATREGQRVGAGRVEIATGAPVPDGADAVVMVEDTGRPGSAAWPAPAWLDSGEQVLMLVEARAGQHVIRRGSDMRAADVVLKELQRMPPSDERWGAKLKVLKENIEHHIEEEEGEMFKTARTVLSRKQLQELGTRMQAMKDEALAGERSGA